MVRESKIEKEVCKYAESKGFDTWKWSSPGNRGVPDRIFVGYDSVFFIEFKATGKEATKLQTYVHNKLGQKHGLRVYVIDDIKAGKMVIDQNVI